MASRSLEFAVIFALLGSAVTSAWQVEVNISMCSWSEFRANVIRDTVYLDGGSLWWQIGYSDGTATQQSDGDFEQVTAFTVNLGQPFGPTTNLTALFKSINEFEGSITESIAPRYTDGVMFANDDELILYGGLTQQTDSRSPPPANAILGYEAYQYGGQQQSNWQAGFIPKKLSNSITRYITNGAGVSVPSENLGYYFSGMRAADWSLIQDGDQSANTTANTLIGVDMSVMRGETWTNDTLPDYIPGRANAELVWVPVSSSGVLIAIGGVINPASLTAAQVLTNSQAAASNKTSPTFMETVSVYDIATKTWYQQNTTGDIPPQLTLFCSVVAAASDGSSYNVYTYGGYDGINTQDPVSDDVYILSVPSFTWIKAYAGQFGHGRSGHKCIKTYPDQMFVLGGVYRDNPVNCLEGGIIQVFNLNTLRFQDSYSPEIWSNYTVPSLVTAQIGGNGQGSATKTAPSAWNTNSLSAVFQSKYTGVIQTYYPYTLVNTTSTSTPSSTPLPVPVQDTGSGFPGWAGAVVGVVVGLMIAAAGATFFLLCRRRRKARTPQGSAIDSHQGTFGPSIMKWLHGTSHPNPEDSSHRASGMNEKDPSVTVVASSDDSRVMTPPLDAHEADSSAVHELDSPTRYELATEYNFNNTETEIENFPSPSIDDVIHLYANATSPTSPRP